MSTHAQEALSDRDLAAVSEKDAHLRYLRPSDGQLVPLVTQSFDQEGQLQGTAQWTRSNRPVNQVPSFQLLSYWILSPVLGREGDSELDLTPSSIGWTALRLVISSPLSIALVRREAPIHELIQSDSSISDMTYVAFGSDAWSGSVSHILAPAKPSHGTRPSL
jgi:hypothetical protein